MCSHVTLYTLDHLPISTLVHLEGVCWIFARPLTSASWMACAPGDANGGMTCRTAQGSSDVDYFLTSAALAETVQSMAVNDQCAESDHCPLTLKMMLQAVASDTLQTDCDSSDSSRCDY